MEREKKIWEEIQLPKEIRGELQQIEEEFSKAGTPFWERFKRLIQELTVPEKWQGAREELLELLKPDFRGMKMLWSMLEAAEISRKRYVENEISNKVFVDTMKCFSRFVKEHKESFGVYGFDRDFWTGRQLSLELFRLGELEYEFVREEGRPAVSVHIPSDAVLDREKIRESLVQAELFCRRWAPAYESADYICSSWLLSPALKNLLSPDSRILWFQSLFQIENTDKENRSFLEWVYKRKDLPLDQLPEETSLQRNMKTYLLKGGWIGEGKGRLKKKEAKS